MCHGDEMLVTIPRIKILPAEGIYAQKGHLYFCEISPIIVHKIIKFGDGGMLPSRVRLDDTIGAPKYGCADMEFFVLGSNGAVYIRSHEISKIVPKKDYKIDRRTLNSFLSVQPSGSEHRQMSFTN
jgi:hypothetical protein